MRNDCFENVNRQRDIAIFAARATLMTLLIDFGVVRRDGNTGHLFYDEIADDPRLLRVVELSRPCEKALRADLEKSGRA